MLESEVYWAPTSAMVHDAQLFVDECAGYGAIDWKLFGADICTNSAALSVVDGFMSDNTFVFQDRSYL